MSVVLKKAMEFKKKYPLTIAWRLKKNCAVVDEHIGSDEKVLYVFVGQKNKKVFDWVTTCVVAITNRRILIGRKRVLFGYAIDSVMPYMFNDLNVRTNILWGTICIDTVDEDIFISNIDKAAMKEVSDNVSKNMFELKQLFQDSDK